MSIINCSLEISAYDLETGWTWNSPATEVFDLRPNSSTELKTAVPVPAPAREDAGDKTAPSGSVVVQARLRLVESAQGLRCGQGEVMARTCDWPQPYKFIDFASIAADSSVSAQVEVTGVETRIVLSSEKPVKCLTLGLESWNEGDQEVEFSDNAVSTEIPRRFLVLTLESYVLKIDLFPGDEQVIVASQMKRRGLKATFLGCEAGKRISV
jgi:beta-mannosidase